MDKKSQEQQKFFADQIEWCQEQDLILAEIESKLYEMKEMAEYALANDVTPAEIARLNRQLDNLKREIKSLEKQSHAAVVQ